MTDFPKLILLFSGKRKSGKDYVTDLLLKKLGADKAVIIRISGPIKSYWAQSNNLHFDKLLSAEAFKEQHRKDMISWSEKQRERDHGVFCRQAIEMYRAYEKPIWIVSDIRRKTDIEWFQNNYAGKIKTIRVEASEKTRKSRGWVFTSGVDDVSSECDLDDYTAWNMKINNDGGDKHLEESLLNILKYVSNESN